MPGWTTTYCVMVILGCLMTIPGTSGQGILTIKDGEDETLVLLFKRATLQQVTDRLNNITDSLISVLSFYCSKEPDQCCTSVQLRKADGAVSIPGVFLQQNVRVEENYPKYSSSGSRLKLRVEVETSLLTDANVCEQAYIPETTKTMVSSVFLRLAVNDRVDVFSSDPVLKVEVDYDNGFYLNNIIIPASVAAVFIFIALVSLIAYVCADKIGRKRKLKKHLLKGKLLYEERQRQLAAQRNRERGSLSSMSSASSVSQSADRAEKQRNKTNTGFDNLRQANGHVGNRPPKYSSAEPMARPRNAPLRPPRKQQVGYPTSLPQPTRQAGYPQGISGAQLPTQQAGYPQAIPGAQLPTQQAGYRQAMPGVQLPTQQAGYPKGITGAQLPTAQASYPQTNIGEDEWDWKQTL